jgi:DNA-binding PadR family transcriptional regulator
MGNLKLTALEEAIMLAISDVPRYGQDIVEVVSAASNGSYQIGPGTLYPALQRLKNRGLIQSKKVQENLTVRNGHCRCYYQATVEGRKVLSEIERIRIYIKDQSRVTQVLF